MMRKVMRQASRCMMNDDMINRINLHGLLGYSNLCRAQNASNLFLFKMWFNFN